jgi:hypothetical protein
LEWVISNHLLPAFGAQRLDRITVEDVDRYRLGKVRDGRLGATSINKTLATLAAILETAVEYEVQSPVFWAATGSKGAIDPKASPPPPPTWGQKRLCRAKNNRWAILDSNQGPLPYQERAGPGLRGSCPGFARTRRALRPRRGPLRARSGRLRLPSRFHEREGRRGCAWASQLPHVHGPDDVGLAAPHIQSPDWRAERLKGDFRQVFHGKVSAPFGIKPSQQRKVPNCLSNIALPQWWLLALLPLKHCVEDLALGWGPAKIVRRHTRSEMSRCGNLSVTGPHSRK